MIDKIIDILIKLHICVEVQQNNEERNKKMKNVSLLCMMLVTLFATTVSAKADELPPPTPTPEIIVFKSVPKPTPTPPVREIHYTEHEISQEVIDEQASIYWKDCNTDEEKLAFSAVAVNRLVYGEPFDDNLEDILKAKSEWNHGHISDRNRDKAKRYLNMALTQYVDGDYAGILIPSGAVYVGRDDSSNKLVFYNINWEEVYRLK